MGTRKDLRDSARTRNARLTAIRSLFSYAALRHPEHAALIAQVLAIPPKRFDKAIVCFLDEPEAAAMLVAADRGTWAGRRDHALMTLAMQTGLRVSELLGLNCGDVVTGTSGHVRCVGKSRKERSVPMTESVRAVMNVWLIERAGQRDDAAFCTRTGRRLSVDAVQRRVTIYAAQARQSCPSLVGKHLSPHVFRHICAMTQPGCATGSSGRVSRQLGGVRRVWRFDRMATLNQGSAETVCNRRSDGDIGAGPRVCTS